MANARIRYAPLYLNGTKIATLHTSTNAMSSGDEAQYDADGYAGHSDGAPMTKISGTEIIPVTGTNVDVISLFKAKSYFEVGQFVGGRWVQVTMRCLSYTVDTERKSGKMEGKFEFEGGEASVN